MSFVRRGGRWGAGEESRAPGVVAGSPVWRPPRDAGIYVAQVTKEKQGEEVMRMNGEDESGENDRKLQETRSSRKRQQEVRAKKKKIQGVRKVEVEIQRWRK